MRLQSCPPARAHTSSARRGRPARPAAGPVFALLALFGLLTAVHAERFNFSAALTSSGSATLTHYAIGPGNGARVACGCSAGAADFPTAAINHQAFGSDAGSGPACGSCFNLTLVEAFLATPPFPLDPAVRPSIVLKITDQCPNEAGPWCRATPDRPNDEGSFMHFDVNSPSRGIPASFFPSDVAKYGYEDFGVWRVNYTAVSCSLWAGYSNASTLGLDKSLHPDQGCCPADPYYGSGSVCKAMKPLGSAAVSIAPSALALLALLSLLVYRC